MQVTLSEAAQLARRSTRQIIRWIESRHITATKDAAGRWLIDLASLQKFATLDPLLMTEIAAAHGLNMTSIIARLDALEKRMAELTARPSLPARTYEPSAAAARERRQAPVSEAQSELPEGLVSLTDFCKQNGIAETTIKKAIQSGRYAGIHRGSWKHGRGVIRYAVDQEQQKQILAQWGRNHEGNDEA